MIVKAIKTRNFIPPKDDLWELLSVNIKSIKENSVVCVTSKIVAIAEGRCVASENTTKDELAIKEADKYIPREQSPEGLILHTVKNNLLVASAGVDESNGDGYFILWPEDPFESAKKIWEFLKEKYQVKNLGVIITDSRLIPLRRGVVGIAIGYYGFNPLKDYRGLKDIFGREFKMETSNIPDSLASAAVLEMGEGAETQPLAVIEDIKDIEFTSETIDDALSIDEKEDMFYPFLASVNWKVGGSGKK